MMIRRQACLVALAVLFACSAPQADGPLDVSVIGGVPRIVNPNRQPLSPAEAVLLSATAQGLVRSDAAGQIEPGLAIRWDVSDDGVYYTFRIADGRGVDAEHVARALRAAIGPASRNPLKSVLGAITEIVAVTPEVVELRLASPRPDLLPLLAQPELAILARKAGTGPFGASDQPGGLIRLTPLDSAAGDGDAAALGRLQVRLHAERAARAVAGFTAGHRSVVLGGRFTDLAVARAASPPAGLLHIDPAAGLFGLAVSTRGGFVGVADNRRALAMTIDRARIADAFGAGWRPAATIVAPGLVDRPSPAAPDWIDADLAQRRTLARETVASWLAAQGEPPLVRLAVPDGPGGRLLFALIADDWARIGVTAIRAATGTDADLTLVDAVAPSDSASWYLRQFECVRSIACSSEADTALAAARTAPSLAARAFHLGEADARLAEISAFIPIAQPLRWSLVARTLGGFQDNRRAMHPLDQLRGG